MSLLNTIKQEIRAKMPNSVDVDENRHTRYGLLTAVQEMTNSRDSIVSPDLREKASMSEGLPLKVPVTTRLGNVTINNTRTCNIGSLDNTTELVTVNWVTLSADMSMNASEHNINDLGYLADFDKKFRAIEDGFARAIEQSVYTKLDTEKSAVYGSPFVGTDYPLVGNTLQVAPAQQEYFFNYLQTIMEGDDFFGGLKVIGNTTLNPDVRHWAHQGAGNDEKLDYQFGNYQFRFSPQVTIGAGKRSAGFVMQDNAIGLMTRNGRDCVLGHKAGDGTEWGIGYSNVLGMDIGYMHKSNCDDLSGTAGLEHLTATKVEKWQFSVDVALITQYNSNPAGNAGGIKKFEFL